MPGAGVCSGGIDVVSSAIIIVLVSVCVCQVFIKVGPTICLATAALYSLLYRYNSSSCTILENSALDGDFNTRIGNV